MWAESSASEFCRTVPSMPRSVLCSARLMPKSPCALAEASKKPIELLAVDVARAALTGAVVWTIRTPW